MLVRATSFGQFSFHQHRQLADGDGAMMSRVLDAVAIISPLTLVATPSA
jgi:hypothetical protein